MEAGQQLDMQDGQVGAAVHIVNVVPGKIEASLAYVDLERIADEDYLRYLFV